MHVVCNYLICLCLLCDFFSGYKRHTDCIENQTDKRDRMATILIYLDDVADGGETSFPGSSKMALLHVSIDVRV